jgi:hypothetical protein
MNDIPWYRYLLFPVWLLLVTGRFVANLFRPDPPDWKEKRAAWLAKVEESDDRARALSELSPENQEKFKHLAPWQQKKFIAALKSKKCI